MVPQLPRREGLDALRGAVSPPRGGLPGNVQWLQIQVYAYWPPGTYRFDNVHLYKAPKQTKPLPEEPARTDSFETSRERTRSKDPNSNRR